SLYILTKGPRRNNFTFCCRPPGPLARPSDELYPGGASNKASGPAGRSPEGRGGGRASALLPLLDDVRHRLRRGASHLPARRSRQNVNLFLREPLGGHCLRSLARGLKGGNHVKIEVSDN